MAYIQRRSTKDGQPRYRVQVRLRGHPVQTATFERKTDAKRWAQQVESAIREGRHFKTSEAKRHTLGDLVDRYIRDVLPQKPKSQHLQTSQLQWWKEQLGDYTLADVTPSLVAECRDRLAAGTVRAGKQRSPGTVNRYLAALSHAFTTAVREWGWVDDSPVRKVSKLKEPQGRVRFLDDDERQRLLDACRESRNRYLYPAVVLSLSTGIRQGELLRLKWADIDLDRGVIVLHETKSGERRAVPLAGHALAVMREVSKVQRIDTPLVFPGRKPDTSMGVRTSWELALKRAGIENFRWHDLRHSTASYLAMNGASLAEIAEVLGHKTLQMVKRYAHLSEQHTARVVERMNLSVFGDGKT